MSQAEKPTITVVQAVKPFLEWATAFSRTKRPFADMLLELLDKGFDNGDPLTTVGELKYKWRVAKGPEEEAFIGMIADVNPGTVRYWNRDIISNFLTDCTKPGEANHKHNSSAYRDSDDHWVWVLWDDLGHVTLYEAKRQDTAKSFYWPYDSYIYILRTRLPKRGVQLPIGYRCKVMVDGGKVRYVKLDNEAGQADFNGYMTEAEATATAEVQDYDLIG